MVLFFSDLMHMTYTLEKQIGQSIMDNAENLATLCTQDEDKQSNNNKNTTQYVLDTTIRKQTRLTQIRHKPSYKQLEVKTNGIA